MGCDARNPTHFCEWKYHVLMLMKIKHLLLFAALISIFSACTTQDNIDWKKYPIITTATELNEYYPELHLDLSGKSETASISTYVDGSKDLTYEYELTETEKFDPLFYSITVDVCPDEKTAEETYTIAVAALVKVGNLADFENEEIDLDIGHDETYYSLRSYEGYLNGHLFITRKGNNVYSLVVSGLYSEDNSLVYDLILPELASLDAFELMD